MASPLPLWLIVTAHAGLSIALGVTALSVPALGAQALLDVLGVYATAAAVSPLYAFVHGHGERPGALVVLAAVGFALGGLTLWGVPPSFARLAVIGWSFLTGCAGLALAMRFPEGPSATLLIAASVIALVFPFALVTSAWRGVLSTALSAFGFLSGGFLLALGIRLRHPRRATYSSRK